MKKCEIRTVINVDDDDLFNLIEKCKEKHKLAELIEKALNAYCYQGEKVPESKREVTGADDVGVPSEVSHELRSLAMQVAVLLNNVQSNHSYTMEAFGRLSAEIGAMNKQTVVVAQNTTESARVSSQPVKENISSVVDIDEDDVLVQELPTTPMEEVSEDEIVDALQEIVQEEKPVEEPKPVVEDKPAEVKSEENSDEDDEDGLSAEALAAMKAFLSGGG